MIEITQYQIVCKDKNVDLKYNGHTRNFYLRQIQHKYSCKTSTNKDYNCKLYKLIREQGGFDNFKFIILEVHFVNNICEARIRERYWYDLLNSNMNKQVPNRNKNSIEFKQYSKQCAKNKIRIRTEQYIENRKIQITCDCGLISSKGNISRHRKSKQHIDLMNSKI
jgi:hypothetical protein